MPMSKRVLMVQVGKCQHCPLLRVVGEGSKIHPGQTWRWGCGFNDELKEVKDGDSIPEWCPIPEGGKERVGADKVGQK
jgi:hypothetical protein